MNNKAIEYFNRGIEYYELGEYDKALEDFNKAIELDDEFKVAYNNRGNIYNELGEYDKALEDFNKAINLAPEYKQAYNNRGTIYAKLGEYDKALEDFNKAIELDDEFKAAYYNRGNIYAKLGEYDKALEDYNEAINLNPEYKETYNNRGILYAKLGEYDKALEDYNEAINLTPEYKETYYNRGNIYAKLGKYDKALEDYKMVIKIDPTDKDAYYNIGITYLKKHGEEDTKINQKLKKIIDLATEKDDANLDNKKYDNKKVSLNLLNLLKEILIDNTYKLEDSQKVIIIKLIIECYDLMEICKVVNEEDKKFIHYTKSGNLKFLLKKEKDLKKEEEPKIRLNNAVYTNDPEEGKILKKLLIKTCEKIDENGDKKEKAKNIIEDIFENKVIVKNNEIIQNSDYCTFLTCFCEEEDKLPMWVHYGEGGKGIGISFKEEFFKDVDLYRVQYEDNKKIEEYLENICKILVELVEIKENKQIEENEHFLELVNIILKHISYLFKDEAYSYEKEVRIIKLKNYNDEDIKLYEDEDGIPKLYIDFENPIKANMIDEVIVGPKGDFEKIATYAKYVGVKTIRKSEIKYK